MHRAVTQLCYPDTGITVAGNVHPSPVVFDNPFLQK